MAAAEANLHHPFAAPPVPRDAGKPVGLGHGCTSMLHKGGRGSRKCRSRVLAREAYQRRGKLITRGDARRRHRRRSASPPLPGHERPCQALQAAREPRSALIGRMEALRPSGASCGLPASVALRCRLHRDPGLPARVVATAQRGVDAADAAGDRDGRRRHRRQPREENRRRNLIMAGGRP
jgi:hypothetical protein